MHSLGIVQWNSIRRDHPGNPGGVSGSGPVISSVVAFHKQTEINTAMLTCCYDMATWKSICQCLSICANFFM